MLKIFVKTFSIVLLAIIMLIMGNIVVSLVHGWVGFAIFFVLVGAVLVLSYYFNIVRITVSVFIFSVLFMIGIFLFEHYFPGIVLSPCDQRLNRFPTPTLCSSYNVFTLIFAFTILVITVLIYKFGISKLIK